MGKGAKSSALGRVLWIAGTVVLLAGVIFGVSALSSPRTRTSEPTVSQPSASVRAQRLAADAQAAASRAETSTALSLAGQALALDPTNSAAKAVKSELATAPASSSAATTAVPGTKPTVDRYASKVPDIKKLFVASAPGWSAGAITAAAAEAQRAYEPNGTRPNTQGAVRAIVYVHDMGSSAKATAFVSKVDRKAYPKDAESTVVGADVPAFSGTDGRQVAVAAFARGRYAFEVIVIAAPGTKPATLKTAALELADQLPAAKK